MQVAFDVATGYIVRISEAGTLHTEKDYGSSGTRALALPDNALKSAKMCAKDAKKCAKDAKKCAGVCGALGVLGVLEKLDAQLPVQRMILPFG